jgi:hypothetical protein
MTAADQIVRSAKKVLAMEGRSALLVPSTRLRGSPPARKERTLVLKKFDPSHAQQVPKPPAPKPGVSPDNVPPLPPPDIPVPDPAPPPVENPGDAPLPPITDPDVIEPGEPSPAHTPMRVPGAKRNPEGPAASSSALKAGADSRNEGSNLFSRPELERGSVKRGRRHPRCIRE